MRETLAKLLAAATLVLVLGLVLLFGWRQQQRIEQASMTVDPASWAALYPQHYASFMRTADNYGRTDHGGSEPYDKLAAKPFRLRAFAGNAFALDYKAARGHYYAQSDQRDSRRTRERNPPAGCINCHAAEAPALIATLGWEQLHAMDYNALRGDLHFGSACSDCHAPDTMALQVTRPALLTALQSQGVDTTALTRDELRTYVCAQCHVEYYFTSAGQQLVLPWALGRGLEQVEAYYDNIGFSDWTHAETGAAMIKMQHPETELYGAGVHAQLGVTCADCHMPAVTEQRLRISDHWIRSPLVQIEAACGSCHERGTPDSLRARSVALQDQTVALLAVAEAALTDLMDAIVAAQQSGVSDEALREARYAQRRAQLRWDFIDAENSTGFHAAAEARRLLEAAAALAREGTAALQ
ncbi:MAG: ammonia-forming cytochrome c nitrite reductase subunit c552 [Pseudomonadales bacterium]|nr:ammonia-forming cytochrome c nitrite reductase subunit c552 [Pseudomonadales bacterium]